MKLFLLILSLVLTFRSPAQDDRIWIDAKINNNPVHLIYDTGADFPIVLFSPKAKELGLKVTPPPVGIKPSPGKIVLAGKVESCNLSLGETNLDAPVGVIDRPLGMDFDIDGIIGWPASKFNVFYFDGPSERIVHLANVPQDALNWPKFPINTNFESLVIDVPEQKISVAIDTGAPDGIVLNPKRWREWKSQHREQPSTYENAGTMYNVMQTIEESWAEKFSLGSVDITSVPVCDSAFGNKFNTMLGMAALARLYLVIDGENGWVYLKPVRIPPFPFQHNRLGADFASLNPTNDDLVAKVAKNGPAYEARIRDGDILLKLCGQDVTHWRTDTNPPSIIRPFDLPAGTQIELTLKRGKKIFNVTPTLRNIIPPDAPKN